MSSPIKLFLVFIISFVGQSGLSQKNAMADEEPIKTFTKKGELKGIYSKYIEDIMNLTANKEEESESEKDRDFLILNNNMLNLFFRDEITSYAKNIKDLSIEKNFASIDSDNKDLTLGFSEEVRHIFRKRTPKDSVRKLSNILTFYTKLPTSDNFGGLFEKDDGNYRLKSKVGFGLKFTHIGNGTISYGSGNKAIERKMRILYERESNLENKFKKEIQKYVDEEFEKDLNAKVQQQKIELIAQYIDEPPKASRDKTYGPIWDKYRTKEDINSLKVDSEEKEKEIIEEKYYHYYKKIADTEASFIRKNKIYNHIRVYWWGANFYLDISRSSLTVRQDTTSQQSESHNFRNINARGFGNFLWSFPNKFKGSSLLVAVDLSAYNNNNFVRNSSSIFSTQKLLNQYSDQGEQIYLFNKDKEFYIGEYREFFEYSIQFEGSTLALNNHIGLSAAIECSIASNYKRHLNWKLGIPVSLKDKDGKPSVNFEIQWKEVREEHFLGFSIGYNFGKFLK